MQVFWKSEMEDFTYPFSYEYLTLSWRRPLSYGNQSIDLPRKSMDWFLYDNGLRHENVKLGSYDCGYSHRSEKFRVRKLIALMGILKRQLLISLLHFRMIRDSDKYWRSKCFDIYCSASLLWHLSWEKPWRLPKERKCFEFFVICSSASSMWVTELFLKFFNISDSIIWI